MTIRLIELFSGIGVQASALERLGLDHEMVAVAEIDEKVHKVYCALHGDTPNLGDITKIEHLPACDLLTYSSPCQDISIAGHKAGLKKGSGTRSATLWEVGRLLEDMRKREILPEVLLMENVDSILFKHAIADFNEWVAFLDSLGYTNSYTIINAKDHGVPQSRKRLFMVSTLTLGKFEFPEPRLLTLRLKDVLETDVDEKFYLPEESIAAYEQSRDRKEPTKIEEPQIRLAGDLHKDGYLDIMNRVYDVDGIAPTINTCSGGGRVPKIAIKQDGRLRIRYLTSRECLRLMGQTDEAIDKIMATGTSKTKLYAMAGNSIVVDVLADIFKGIYIDETFEKKNPKLEDYL